MGMGVIIMEDEERMRDVLFTVVITLLFLSICAVTFVMAYEASYLAVILLMGGN